MVNGTSVRVNFWDLSGKTEYLEIRNEFYKDTQAALLVYDVTDRSSFDALEEWLDEAAKFGARIPPLPVSLCANKVDKRREVSEAEGQAFANAHGFEVRFAGGRGVVGVVVVGGRGTRPPAAPSALLPPPRPSPPPLSTTRPARPPVPTCRSCSR